MKADILGCGPSLHEYRLRKDSIIFGANRAILYYDIDVLIIWDKNTFDDINQRILEIRPLIYTTKKGCLEIEGSFLLPLKSGFDFRKDMTDGLWYIHSSGFLAAQLAVLQGFNDLAIWGIDFGIHKTYDRHIEIWDLFTKQCTERKIKIRINA